MVPILTATRFSRFMSSGRTKPAIFTCEDSSGKCAGEYVVKLRGGFESGYSGLLHELMAARLATHFGIAAPQPAVIRIEKKLAALITEIEPLHATLILNSIGLNFGTKLVCGFSTWPVDKSIPPGACQIALNIFAFDVLVQNPDRRFDNPNLFVNGDSVLIFDHEMAFSFLLDILPSSEPWKLEKQTYLKYHVFYKGLKSKVTDLTGFINSLSALSDTVFESLMADIPVEWNNDSVPKIFQHIRLIRDHTSDFDEEIRRFLV